MRLLQQEDRGTAWCAGVDNAALAAEAGGDMASRNIGRPRGAEAGVCVVFSLHVSSHISRRVICVSRLWVHGCDEERVRAAALINAWISVDPRCTVAGVRKRLQASGIERSRRSVHEYMAAEHWPAKQVVRG